MQLPNLITTITLLLLTLTPPIRSFKLPFQVHDVLPVLPRQISWPVMNTFGRAVDLLPSFVGTISPTNGSVAWNGACFGGNEARMEFTNGDDRGLGGGVIYLKVSQVLC